jgi:hypothetical protein
MSDLGHDRGAYHRGPLQSHRAKGFFSQWRGFVLRKLKGLPGRRQTV